MSVFVWGFGKQGQLGNGQTNTCHTPVQPRLPRQTESSQVRNGGYFTVVLCSDGRLYTFGCGKHGRLGSGDETDRSEPYKVVVGDEDNNVRFKRVSAGIWHGAAVCTDDNLYVWGFGKSHGVLGNPSITHGAPPTLLTGPFRNNVAGVSCGNNFTLAWTSEGMGYSWGCGRHGVLGHNDTTDKHEPELIPTMSESGSKIKLDVLMDAGYSHCGAVTDSGTVFMWGRGEDGALGVGKNPPKTVPKPTQMTILGDVNVHELSCSLGEKHGHTLFVSDQGYVFSCGDGYKGKLGLGDQESRVCPTLIPCEHFQGQPIVHVAAGGIHSAAVSKSGDVFTWGCGSDGRLGHPEAKGHRYLFRSDTPRLVEAIKDKGKTVEVSCSYYHTSVLVRKDDM